MKEKINTISFDRETYEKYRDVFEKALQNNQNSFVFKNSLIPINSDSIELLNKLQRGFENPITNTVRLIYKTKTN